PRGAASPRGRPRVGAGRKCLHLASRTARRGWRRADQGRPRGSRDARAAALAAGAGRMIGENVELVTLLFIAVVGLNALARRLLIPYPILLVVGGLLLALVPGLPSVRLDPDMVFFIFLPPILWAAAYFTSFRDFSANARPIALLAVGLV